MLVLGVTGETVDCPSWSQPAHICEGIRVKVVIVLLVNSLLLRSAVKHCAKYMANGNAKPDVTCSLLRQQFFVLTALAVTTAGGVNYSLLLEKTV